MEELRGAADHETGNEHREDHEGEHAVEAAAHAAEHHFPDLHEHQAHQGREAVHAVEGGVHRSAGSGGGTHGPKGTLGHTDPGFLSFHIHLLQFGNHGSCQCQDKEHTHGRKEGGPLLPVFHHEAEGEAQGHGDQQDQHVFQDIGQRGGVLKGIRGIALGDPPAVGAGLFDGDLRGGQSCRNALFCDHHGIGHRFVIHIYRPVFDDCLFQDRSIGRRSHRFGQGDILLAAGIHGHPLPGEDHTGDQAHGNEDEENGTGHVLPEVSQRRGLPARQAPDQGEEHTDAHSRGHKVLDRDSEGFRHPSQGQHGVIGLPVGVGHEGTGGSKRHQRIHPVHQQHDQQQDQGSCREGEHRREILLPVHLPAGYVQPVQEEGFGFVHKCDVVVHDFFAPQSEGNGQGHCQNQRQNGK